jgi:hypothetical protein
MSGGFRGLGERLWVEQAPAGALSVVKAKSCQSTTPVIGKAFSFFAGQAHTGASAVFYNTAFQRTRVNGAGVTEFYIEPNSGPKVAVMPKVEDAMCYFTSIRGKFNGPGEWAGISKNSSTGHWELRGGTTPGRPLPIYARCLARDQRQSGLR